MWSCKASDAVCVARSIRYLTLSVLSLSCLNRALRSSANTRRSITFTSTPAGAPWTCTAVVPRGVSLSRNVPLINLHPAAGHSGANRAAVDPATLAFDAAIVQAEADTHHVAPLAVAVTVTAALHLHGDPPGDTVRDPGHERACRDREPQPVLLTVTACRDDVSVARPVLALAVHGSWEHGHVLLDDMLGQHGARTERRPAS